MEEDVPPPTHPPGESSGQLGACPATQLTLCPQGQQTLGAQGWGLGSAGWAQRTIKKIKSVGFVFFPGRLSYSGPIRGKQDSLDKAGKGKGSEERKTEYWMDG